ncbi:TPA: phage tail spike protein [Streptococcus suis]
MIYLFDKDEKLIKIVRKSAVKTALQKYALTTERYVSDRLTVELKGLNADELEQVEYMAIQTMEDAHTFHYFYVAQKFSDSLTTLIGVQSGIEELRKSPVYDKRPQNALARDVITDLLAGTNWRARFVGETTPHSTNFYYTSIFDALKKVCEVWDLEMQFFVEMNGNRIGARYIDFKQRIGEAVGKRVVYGHNALQILQEVERTNIFTALVGRGKGEETGDGYGRKITFENVVWSRTQGKPVDKPKGQKYLELPLMTRQYGIKNADGSMRPKIGFADFSEEENPDVLIERTYRALVDAARPQLTLKTSSVYLRGVKVGDTIRVVRHDKKLDYDTRIFEITFNRLNNQSSDIKLGDRIGESNEAKVQTIADKAVEQFVNNEFSNFIQNLPDYLPSADGFNNNWYGTEDPTVKYPGKVLINDIWYKPDPEHEGHKIMLRWTGEVWEEILRTYESEALRERIAEEIAQVEQSMQAQAQEHDRQVADILSKTQSVESLANQAKSDAASAIARANQVKTEAIADARAQVATVNQALNAAKTELQSAIASADQKARDSQASATALRNDLNSQANKILAQAQAQTALTSRVTTVETLADGTKTTVAELSKTVNKATGDIASVTSRTKTVEDTLSQTRTQYEALTQTVNAQTGQIDSINRKTADLQSGIDGVNNRFETIWVSEKNLLSDTETLSTYAPLAYPANNYLGRAIKRITKSANTSAYAEGLVMQTNETLVNPKEMILSFYVKANRDARIRCFMYNPNANKDVATSDGYTAKSSADGMAVLNVTTSWQRVWIKWTYLVNYLAKPRIIIGRIIESYDTDVSVDISAPALYHGHHNKEWSPADLDFKNELATYVQNAQESSAELVRRIETADGKAVDAKVYAQQTANGFNTRIESLESYKNAEGTRASQYLTASRTETAKQLSAERVAIANNYLAKSTYTEDVRGTTQKLNEIKSTADTTKQNLANYQTTVDRKLTELTSSTQTLDGKINTASAKVDTVAGQIRTEISNVEAKIPTDLGGRNYILKSDVYATSGSKYFDTSPEFIDYAYSGKYVTISLDIKGENLIPDARGLSRIGCELRLNLSDGKVLYLQCQKIVSGTQPRERISVTKQIPQGVSVVSANKVNMYIQVGGTALAGRPKFELSSIPSDWSPAPEDINSELSSTKTLITQTAEGQTQLSNRLTTTQDKVSTAETKINQLIGDVSSKVSQRDYDNLTGRVSNAETLITQNANEISKRLTSTQVETAINAKGYQTASQVNTAITGKGYQTKSDVDSNITGRGYITSSALQPYALATTVQNLVKETADSFSRTISAVRLEIPTSSSMRNLILKSSDKWGAYTSTNNANSNWCSEICRITLDSDRGISVGKKLNLFVYISADNVTLDSSSNHRMAIQALIEKKDGTNIWHADVPFHGQWSQNLKAGNNYYVIKLTKEIKATAYENGATLIVQCRIDGANHVDFHHRAAMITTGDMSPDAWSPAPEDLATVTALHDVKDTVSSHTRTIGAVGTAGSILDNVSKVTQTAAGLVAEVSGANGLKTQVSTLAGSYAIKNLTKAGDVLGQINLNKDGSVRINEGLISIGDKTYIKNGVIKSAMIGNGQIGTAHIGEIDAGIAKIVNLDVSTLTGFDAAFIKGKFDNVIADLIKGKNIYASNSNMNIDLQNGMITMRNGGKFIVEGGYTEFARQEGLIKASLTFRDSANTNNGIKLSVDDGLGKSTSVKHISLDAHSCYVSGFDEISLRTSSGNWLRITDSVFDFKIGGFSYSWNKSTFEKIAKL